MNKQEPRDPGLAARRAAARILGAVLVERQFLDAAVSEAGAELAPPERARARTIADGVLRRLTALDAVIDPHLRRDTPVRVRHVLRVAAWEMLVDGVAAHAAVDGAVRSVKATRKIENLAGLTNAVSRKLEGAALDTAPQTLPGYLRKPLVRRYGGAAVATMETVQSAIPPLDISLKNRAEPGDWADRLDATLLPQGSLRLTRPGQITALPGFDTGDWWVQDAAAAIPVQLLGPVAGLRVLDLCAAPGGKTMQLAALGAQVTAVDLAEDRMARVADNLERTGLKADLVVANALGYEANPFDIVLLDAPCSATGTLRRHPDLPHIKKDLALDPLLKLQKRLVAQAARLVAPGGRLLYCTCSLLPQEGAPQVYDLQTSGWEAASLRAPGLDPAWFDKSGHLQLRPDYWADQGGMDGFFATVLRKPA